MRKKILSVIPIGIVAISILAGCGATTNNPNNETIPTSSETISTELIGPDFSSMPLIKVNIDGVGMGQIAIGEDGGSPEFDDEYPMQSAFTHAEKGEKLKIGAKADDGSKFVKWTKDGEDFSEEKEIEIEVEGDVEYRAIFEKLAIASL